MAKASVREISRITGFSPATVSNALNHKRSVSEETARIIRETAQSLGYQQAAQLDTIHFLMARKNGLIVDESTFHPAVIEGVERQARRHGMSTSFVSVDFSDLNEARAQVAPLISNASAAVILLGTELGEEDYAIFENATAHLIVLDGWSERYDIDAVLMANEDSVFRAMSSLVERGHTRIGYLAGAFRIYNFRARGRAYEMAMREMGLEVRPEWRIELGTTLESAYEDMNAWLDAPDRPELPTAFFADNDLLAVGALRALREHGIDIPGDVSIVGFDDLSVGAFSTPPLTTIHVLKHEVGEIAVRRLLGGIENPKQFTCKTQVSTYAVERESVRDLNS